uniref:Pelovaterin n=1 Tax=Siphoviridae sp. cthIt11 TaxID=2826423 RepID=A0A8S5QUM1_9CAUD|nr:MAG TPA: Pelovaterin [Siphoviridae sp. cthIt11]
MGRAVAKPPRPISSHAKQFFRGWGPCLKMSPHRY